MLLKTEINKIFHTETTEKDKRLTEKYYTVGQFKLLMPECLNVGNTDLSSDFFIGICSGFISPVVFDAIKEKSSLVKGTNDCNYATE